MKKSLVLAMAMALGVTASAYAANPFSDVPAGHWAYDSISKLAAAGVIEGYGDDTFRGDRLMTRYEMAQIVAKAMAQGANVDKLAAEFADELDALGVRVAALEKKSDNVIVTGEARLHYRSEKLKWPGGKDNDSESGLRTRIYLNGKVNDNWNYLVRIQNMQTLHGENDEGVMGDYIGDDKTYMNIAKLEGRLGGLNVTAGRDDDVVADGYIYDGGQDVVKLSYGDKWYVSGAYGKLTDLNEPGATILKDFWNAEIGSNMDGFVNFKTGYFKTKFGPDGEAFLGAKDLGVWYAGADFSLTDDLAFNAMYLRSNRDNLLGEKSKKDGYVFGLAYKGAEADEPGSWGLSANYYRQGRGTYLQHTIDGETGWAKGFKGWSVGGDIAVAKNMVLGVTYYDTKELDGDESAKVIWSEFNISF